MLKAWPPAAIMASVAPVSKTVMLVLVDEGGAPLGVLPAFEVDFPYWQETTHIVDVARERFGLDVTVLRILATEPGLGSGGAVIYLAEASHIPERYATAVDVDLAPHPLRAPYAEAGGPAASLRWAAKALDDLGRGPLTAAVQRRTWNLSAIWWLETPSGPVWLKQVPHFFAHEPAVLGWISDTVGGQLVPELLAHDDGRMLLDHIRGEDLYDAGADVRGPIAVDFHVIQTAAVASVNALVAAGVPDRRATSLIDVIGDVVARHGGGDARLDDLVAGLGDRLTAVAACGLPDTLAHGDLHPGNVRSDGRCRVIIDWGDSYVGNPAFDIIRLSDGLEGPEAAALVDAWADRWRADVPGCDPLGAVELLRPVAALRNAVVYATFLDHIEPAEHPYHAADVSFWLDRAVTPR